MIGAGAAGLLGLVGLAAPAAAGDPIAQPAPASSAAGGGSPAGEATPEEWDGPASGATGRVVVMTLSKRPPQPEPRTASNPGELSKHALAKRPSGASN
jgi:hypothetical protein